MIYKITAHTKEQAKRYGVTVRPSVYSNKKLDVFKDGKYLVSIGAAGYTDYGTLLEQGTLEEAERKRRLYKIRHANNTGLAGTWAMRLLW